ncbi:MAG: hypothetical protein J5J06_00500 [Phycisphaerae bacterium]|nr:hypothetical protein [Phycisphaerae bacterium]
MDRGEILRWSGSIGIFYLLVPAYLVTSDAVIARVAGFDAVGWSGVMAVSCYLLFASLGLLLITTSIRAQVTRGRGHPFDMTGRESFSRPTQTLLTGGVYALCRNPMGLGDVFLYMAITGLAGAFWSMYLQVPAYAAVVVLNHLVNERPALLRRFPSEFPPYERVTPLLIPTPASVRRALARASKASSD